MMMINSCQSASEKTPSENDPISEKLELQSYDSNNRKYMTIEISDTGIGMTEEVQKQLNSSEDFVSEMHEMNQSGVGLGVSICKKIAYSMDGKLKFTSKLN